jgi:hypothetical protein
MISKTISVTDSKPIKERSDMKKLNISVLFLFSLLFLLTDCKKKNSEVSFQDQINGIQNLNLLQHTLNNITMSYIKAIHDTLLNDTVPIDSIELNSCYIQINHNDGNHILTMNYGSGKYYNERWRQGIIKAITSDNFTNVGSITNFSFENLMFDAKQIVNGTIIPLNIITSGSISITLTEKTDSKEIYTQTVSDFRILSDTIGQPWSSMNAELIYNYQKSDTSGQFNSNDVVTISMNATYNDQKNRGLTSTTVNDVQFPENCCYLASGESEIEITAPVQVTGNFFFTSTPKVCLSRFRFEATDGRLFEIVQDWENH